MIKLEFDEFVQRTIRSNMFYEAVNSYENYLVSDHSDIILESVDADPETEEMIDSYTYDESEDDGLKESKSRKLTPEDKAQIRKDKHEAKLATIEDLKEKSEAQVSSKGNIQDDLDLIWIKFIRNNRKKDTGAYTDISNKAYELYEGFKMKYIYRLVQGMINTKPELRSQREEMIEECRSYLFLLINEKFDPKTKNKFNAYLKTCLTGILLNFKNAGNRAKSIVDGKTDVQLVSLDAPVSGTHGEWADKDTTVADAIPDEHDQQAENDQNELSFLTQDVLDQLPEKDAKILRMRFFEDKTYQEIGNVLGMTATGVKKGEARALDEAKTIFIKYMNE